MRVTTSYPPKERCLEKMGIDANSELRPGVRFSASSNSADSQPEYGRLNYVDENMEPKAWETDKYAGEFLAVGVILNTFQLLIH